MIEKIQLVSNTVKRWRTLQEISFKASAVSAATLLMATLLMTSMTAALATVRIYDDPGGQIGEYLAKFKALRISGEHVVIDGTCASACTMLLGAIPRNRICVTPRATLVFHGAWDPTPTGEVNSTAGNQILWSKYPSDVRKWISRHGGLRSQLIYLQGPDLFAMYPLCH
jgi:ATP-dependent protease ClpP protease subunit